LDGRLQTHIVIDRHCQPHTLQPGQRKHGPDRFYPTIDPTKPGRPKPLHPIVIEGIGPIPLLGKGYE
jgi:hypothetical protein